MTKNNSLFRDISLDKITRKSKIVFVKINYISDKENLKILNEHSRQASFIKCLIGSLTMPLFYSFVRKKSSINI